MNFPQFIAILKARSVIFMWIFLVAVLTTLIISLILPKTYRATTTLVIDAKGADPITGNTIPATLMPGYMATQVDIIESQNVALKVVKNLNVASNANAKAKYVESTEGKGDINLWYANQFLENLNVEPSKESNLIEISYSGADSDFAATLANAFAQGYIETNLELKTEPIKQAALFFNEQLKGLRNNVEKAQNKLSSFQKEHGITTTDGRLDVEMARLSDLSSQLVMAQAQRYDSTSRKSQLNRRMSDSPDIISNGLIQMLKSQLVQAESKLSDLSNNLGSNHPKILAAQDPPFSVK
jgi:polysaccharide biosynthesis transport protein